MRQKLGFFIALSMILLLIPLVAGASATDWFNTLTNGNPVGSVTEVSYSTSNELSSGTVVIESFSRQSLDNDYTRFTLTYTAPAGYYSCLFQSAGDLFFYDSYNVTTTQKQTIAFDLQNGILTSISSEFTIIFYTSDDDCFVINTEYTPIPTNTILYNITNGNPVGEQEEIEYNIWHDDPNETRGEIHSVASQKLDNGYTRFIIKYTVPEMLSISVFNPPDGEEFKYFNRYLYTSSEKSTLTFDVDNEKLVDITISIGFIDTQNDYYWVLGLNFIPGIVRHGSCGDNLNWVLDDEGTLTISGSGNTIEAGMWKKKDIRRIVIDAGITSIGDESFSGCSNITSFAVPEGVTSIGYAAFADCSSLTSISLPESVTSIGYAAFYNCNSLASISIPEGVTSIEGHTFWQCSNLTSITIPDSVTGIGELAFAACSNLTSITIPEGVTSIEAIAFAGCSSLTSITLPDGLNTIMDHAFYECTNLTSITIPDSMTNICISAFEGCNALESVDYAGTAEQWSTINIETGNDCLTNAEINYGIDPSSHTHVLTENPQVDANCTTPGTETYWSCDICGKLFSDEEAANEIDEPVVIPALGHSLTKQDRVEATESEDGTEEYWSCINCGLLFSDEDATNEIQEPVVIPATGTAGYGDYAYFEEDGYITITSYLGHDDYVIVPETIDGYIVDIIADNAFASKEFITSAVRIPYGVLVEDNAFTGTPAGWVYYGETSEGFLFETGNGVIITGYTEENCALELPNDIDGYPVTGIGDYAFDGRADLVGTLSLPTSVRSVGKCAFRNCTGLAGGFEFIQRLTSIGDYAFAGCSGLYGVVTIHNSNWGSHVFENCNGITGFVAEQASIPDYMFAGCTGFTKTEIDLSEIRDYQTEGDVEWGFSIGQHAFDGSNITALSSSMVSGWDGASGTGYDQYHLDICDYAFANSTLHTVIIDMDSVNFMAGIFDNCQLNTLSLNAHSLGIGTYSNVHCNEFGVTAPYLWIPQNAFVNCSFGILSLYAANGDYVWSEAVYMNDGSFCNCNIDNLSINGGSDLSIPAHGFSNCTLGDVSIGSYNVYIGDNAFENDHIKSFYAVVSYDVEDSFPQGGFGVGKETFKNCIISDKIILINYNPEAYIALGEGCFYNASTGNGLIIPGPYDNLIPAHAFDGFQGDITIQLSQPITTVGDYAFANTTGSFNVAIESLASIGNYSFYNATGLTQIELAGNLSSIGAHAFEGCSNVNGNLMIPSTIRQVPEGAFKDCGFDGKLTLPVGLTTISDYAFANASFSEIILPSTLRNLGVSCFSDCDGITSITIPARTGGSFIADDNSEGNVFANCSNLQSVIIKSGVSRIGQGVFTGCSSLETITIPSSVTSIGTTAFSDCNAELLYAVKCNSFAQQWAKENGKRYYVDNHTIVIDPIISPTLTEPGITEGRHCSVCNDVLIAQKEIPSLMDMDVMRFPDFLTTIETEAFENVATEAIIIPDTVTTIEPKAFRNCEKLLYVRIPADLIVPENAFEGCPNVAIDRQ